MKPEDVCRDNIWNYRQNKPHYIADDLLEHGVPKKVTYKILLARGVFKWFAIRRDLIKLKDSIKQKVIKIHKEKKEAKENGNHFHYAMLKGYEMAYVQIRKDIRKMCHGERWQAPDFDKEARRFLNEIDNKQIT